ncbi:MAG: DUF1800 domain-containing protein [Ilumatobacteraceae bacterium]|nr:DUF1800 domain-containing protein [Ilumatobacteraceae bacterium]
MPIEPTPRNAAHLWRRAAFGATPEELAQTQRNGIEATVAAMFDHRRAVDAGRPLRSVGYSAYETEHLNLWFLRLATTSPTPAIEKLTWFWHGHFATNLDKFENPELLHAQLLTFRRYGLGRFDGLLKLMARDPAMILWLDLEQSIVGRPNENYARELMELFSLGVDGGYNQFDVANAGRAFTGYTLETDRPPTVMLNAGLHDDGTKTIFGQTGRFDGDDVVDLIVARPECHRFVATRLWTRYAGTTPPNDVLEFLSAAFATRLSIKDLLVAMFTHPAFYADDVRNGLVAQPVESVVAALRGLGIEIIDVSTTPIPDDEDLDAPAGAVPWFVPIAMLEEMGQFVGHPPNVGGWPHNEPWLDATRSAGRLNAAIVLAEWIDAIDSAPVRAIRAAADRDPRAAVGEMFAALGIAEWSDETAVAIVTALTAAGGAVGPLPTALTVALTSPEVILS